MIEEITQDQDEFKSDELETLQNKVADQLSELSSVDTLPSGYKTVANSFDATDIDFSSSGWLLRVLQVQPWLRLDDGIDGKLAESNPFACAIKFFVDIKAEAPETCISNIDGNIILTLIGCELLSERLDIATRLQQTFIESLETLNKKQATNLWVENWEEEGNFDAPPSEQIRAKSTTWCIDQFTYFSSKGSLNLNPSYQRGDVWPTSDAQKLMESILRGIPLPSIILLKPKSNTKRTQYEVVDGKQRLTSILRFIGQHPQAIQKVNEESEKHNAPELKKLFNENYKKFRTVWKRVVGETLTDKLETQYYFPFCLKNGSNALSGTLSGLAGKYYCQIHDEIIDVGEGQESVFEVFEKTSQYCIPLIEYLEATPRQIQEVFHLYNKQGKHLNAEEIRNALFHQVDLVRLLLVAAGDNKNAPVLAPYFPSDKYYILDEISSYLDGYRFGNARYKRTKILSWLLALLIQPSFSKNELLVRSTAKQSDELFGAILKNPNHKLNDSTTLVTLMIDLEKCLNAHSSADCWHEQFRDDDTGLKWQELQLVASLVGVFLLGVNDPNPENLLAQNRKEILEYTKNHRRPESTQNKTQWGFIGEVSLGLLDILKINLIDLDEKLISLYGESCLPTLQAAKVHYQARNIN